MKCQVSKYLAYAMAIYTLASMYYMCRSRLVGTPFNDSLSDKQKHIKKQSSKVRKNIFIEGIIISSLLIVLTRPFKSC